MVSILKKSWSSQYQMKTNLKDIGKINLDHQNSRVFFHNKRDHHLATKTTLKISNFITSMASWLLGIIIIQYIDSFYWIDLSAIIVLITSPSAFLSSAEFCILRGNLSWISCLQPQISTPPLDCPHRITFEGCNFYGFASLRSSPAPLEDRSSCSWKLSSQAV